MTGYGRGGAGDERVNVQVEASSVNRKNLEINIYLPREWQPMERDLMALAKDKLGRGRIVFQVGVTLSSGGTAFECDEMAVASAIKRLKQIAFENAVDFDLTSETFMRVVQLAGGSSELPPWEKKFNRVRIAFEEALNSLAEMRTREGVAIHKDLKERINAIRAWKNEVATLAGESVPNYREALHERLKQAGLELELEDERVLKEIALFADKCDVSEELTRLDSHLEQFEDTMTQPGIIGRKLDFLCQEIFREINTVGSKANNLQVTHRIIDMKNELERVREQVQNIE